MWGLGKCVGVWRIGMGESKGDVECEEVWGNGRESA